MAEYLAAQPQCVCALVQTLSQSVTVKPENGKEQRQRFPGRCITNGRPEEMRPFKRCVPLKRFRLCRIRLERHLPYACWRCQRCTHTCVPFEAERPAKHKFSPEAVNPEELPLRLNELFSRGKQQRGPPPMLPLQVWRMRQLEQD